MIKGKQGDIGSLIITLVVIVFAVGVITMMFSKFFLELTSVIKDDPTLGENNNTKETIDMLETNTIPWLDYFFLFSFIATIVGLIISSIYIDVHPALMVIFIIMLFAVIIFAGIFANVFVEIGETSEMTTTYDQFTMTKAIMNKLPLICFIVGLIVIFILYGKGRNTAGSM